MESNVKTAEEIRPEDAALPSTNALAVLSLLATAPMTAYGIAEQTERALGYLWSVSRSLLLGQPRKLAAAGLVEQISPAEGSRASKRWVASERGRRVLRHWLSTDVEPTRISSEIGLRLVFADKSDLAALQSQIDLRLTQVAEEMRTGISFVEPYLAGTGPFPQRLHIVVATLALIEKQAVGELRGLQAARELIDTWADTTTPEPARDLAAMKEIQNRLRATVDELELGRRSRAANAR